MNFQMWAAKQIDGDIVVSSGASPSLGLLDLSIAGMLSDVAEPPLANCDCFAEVAESIDQLDDNEWDSEDNLPADFVVANNSPMERENQEDIFYAAANNTFSVIVTGKKAIDVPDGADILQLGLTEVLDAPDVSFPPIHFSKLGKKDSTAVFSDVGCSIRGSGGQGIGEALWNVNGLVMKEHEPGKANAEAETPTKVRGWKLDGMDSCVSSTLKRTTATRKIHQLIISRGRN